MKKETIRSKGVLNRIIEKIKERKIDMRIIPIEMVYITVMVFFVNTLFYGFLFSTVVYPQFSDDVRGSLFWYGITPMTIDFSFMILMYVWHKIGLSRINTDFPDSFTYVFIGSLIYCILYGVLGYFMGSYRLSVLYFFAPVVEGVMHNTKKWIASTTGISALFAALNLSGIIEVPTYRLEYVPVWAEITYGVETIVFLAFCCYFIFIFRQASENATEASLAREQAKNAFLANISHEIRTPLNSMLGFNQMILEESPNKDITRYSENVRESGTELLSMIDDILLFSKVGENEVPVRFHTGENAIKAGEIKTSAKVSKPITQIMIENFKAPDSHILVVDDVSMNLTIFRGLLKDSEINIDTALSGKEAIELVKKKTYDMIFLDHMMPEMDGIETYRFMIEHNLVKPSVPAVMLTANAISGADEVYYQAGFDDYLSKPVTADILKGILMKHLPDDKFELRTN